MKFTEEMRNITRNYASQLDQADQSIQKAVDDNRLKGSEAYKEQIAQAQKDRRSIFEHGLADLDARKNAFADELAERYQPHGEDLTPDAMILQTDIKLTEDEIINYLEKYQDNLTMMRLISDYATKMGIDMGAYNKGYVYFSKEEKLIQADRITVYCKNALSDPLLRAEIIENDQNYAKICGDALTNE